MSASKAVVSAAIQTLGGDGYFEKPGVARSPAMCGCGRSTKARPTCRARSSPALS